MLYASLGAEDDRWIAAGAAGRVGDVVEAKAGACAGCASGVDTTDMPGCLICIAVALWCFTRRVPAAAAARSGSSLGSLPYGNTEDKYVTMPGLLDRHSRNSFGVKWPSFFKLKALKMESTSSRTRFATTEVCSELVGLKSHARSKRSV